MSEELYGGPRTGLGLGQYIGPEIGFSIKEEPWTADRRRYQIGTADGRLLTLSRGEWLDLADYFREAGPDC
jgi:hypothetical protein